MSNDKLSLHQIFKTVKCKLVKDPDTGRRRFVALPNQGIPTDMFIEADRCIRSLYELGIVFIASEISVHKKKIGRLYLPAKNQSLIPIIELKLGAIK